MLFAKNAQQLNLFDAQKHPRDGTGKFKSRYSGTDGLDKKGEKLFSEVEDRAVNALNSVLKDELPFESMTFKVDGELSDDILSEVNALVESVKQKFSADLESIGIDLEESSDWLDWENLEAAADDYLESAYAYASDPQRMTLGEIEAELKALEESGNYRGTANRFFALLDAKTDKQWGRE